MPIPAIVAHRGGSAFPENSFAAFKHACTLGVEQVEFDVHLSRDGELAIIHDYTLDQTTVRTGPVRDLTLDELAGVRLRGLDAAEGVPAFDAVMALLASHPIHARIEIKTDDRPGAYAAMHERVMRAVTRHDMAGRVTIMAFELEALSYFIREGIDTSLSWMRHGQQTMAEFDELLGRIRNAGVADIGLSFGPLTLEMLERIAAHSLTAGVWTVNDPGRLDYWLGMPISYILTDQPEIALRIRQGKAPTAA